MLAGCVSMFWLALVLERRISPLANGVSEPEVEAEPVLERPHPATDLI